MSDDWWYEPPLEQPAPPVTQPAEDDEPKHPVAVLWIPDPEQMHGWREFYIRRTSKPGERRPLGYRGKKR